MKFAWNDEGSTVHANKAVCAHGVICGNGGGLAAHVPTTGGGAQTSAPAGGSGHTAHAGMQLSSYMQGVPDYSLHAPNNAATQPNLACSTVMTSTFEQP